MARFSGRKVLITGAGSGIGREMTRLFLEEGASVIGADLDPSNVPAGAHQFKVDTSSEDDVAQLFTAARDTLGGVDILCNNAGIGSTTSVLDATVAEWDRVFAVNVRGTFLCTKYALPYMLDQKAGVIVNTASVAGMIGLADRASYAASKGAVIALTKQVAVQWAKDGIRCNCVCPGTVDSPWVGLPWSRVTTHSGGGRNWWRASLSDALRSPSRSPRPRCISPATTPPSSPAPSS